MNLDALESVTFLDGGVVVRRNASLRSILGLLTMGRVKYAAIEENPRLCASQVEMVHMVLMPHGTQIEGNDDSC